MDSSSHTNRGQSKKLFSAGQNGCCSASDESDCDIDLRRRQEEDDLVNQYERIGDRSSGASTGSSGLSSANKPTAPKATHYAESAIYKRSRGYPSPDSETSTLPANYGPTPVAQYLINRVAGISASNAPGGASSGGMNSSEPWSSSAIGCHTLERNIDSSCNKNNNKIANNLLSSSVHHLLSSSAGVDTIGNSCGPLIDAQRGGDYDPATTCLVRTQSGSLFIPTDFGDRDGATTCLVRSQPGSRFITGDASNKANPLQAANDFDRMLSSHHHSMAPIIKCDTSGKSVLADRGMMLSTNAGRLATRATPMSMRKTLSAHCNWKCAAITFIFLSIALLFAICCFLGIYMSAESDQTHVCPVMMVETELNPNASDRKKVSKHPIAAKSHEDVEAAKLNFMEVKLGKTHSQRVPSYGHWNVQLLQKEPTLVKFNYTIPAGVTVGVYGGKNRIPSHTKYDFMEVLGSSVQPLPISRITRSNHVNTRKLQTAEFIQFLDRGNWYITIYNDESQPQEISFVTLIADESNIRCPNDCNGHGTCVMGTCKCETDYSGDSCEHRVCPAFCSNRGKYVKGQCACNSGWKGKECELREEECEVSDCSGHGDCVDGVCHCFPGYKGQHCEEVDCLDPDCSGHGVCVNGMCLCGKGWKGAHCNEPDSNALRCLPDCSGHGSFDLDLQQCMCDNRWMGADCSQERCDLDCGANGHCQSSECVCLTGWTGSKCEERFCDPRCLEHGQCKNGTCFCSQGWNGKHCTLEGCPRNCNNRGECVERDNEWECECNPNWTGHDCSIALEKDCNDRKDNDNDGLIDCADSECCAAKECAQNPLCFSSSDPLDILLRKQPPPATASFFQRMQFLIEENSVQSYAHKQAFNDSRASVIRGQVRSPSGSGLMGVRVGIANEPLLGFVVSRETGWFDIMVNGGGAVTLHFQRDPFRPTQRTVMVPWNEIVVIDKVKMNVDERKLPDYRSPICVEHDYDSMRPLVLGAWKHGFQGGCNQEKGSNEKSAISSSESQVVQETISISGTDIALVYHSSRAQGYMSTLDLQLTPEKVPSSLRQVHVKIAIEGNLFERVFEGDPNIKYTYSWNRRNVYRQKVYGIANAIVHVGYEYLNCPQIIWEVQAVKLAGFDMSISEIGGWNLNIHHRFNFHEAIVHKGEGSNVYLHNRPKTLGVIMGDGQQRPLHCPYCNGLAKEQRLLAPVALASGPDGSVYVGDFNLIRRISSDGKVSTIIELSASQVAYKYHLTVSPFDGKLYISDPEKHQILRAITLIEPIHNPRNNLEVVVGSGVKCLPGSKNQCGDGRHARDARLAYPKGIAISLNNEMFIADGTNIRMVDSSGIIHTLIGDHYHKSHWKPFPCSGTIPMQKVNLRWPTELAINPLDNSLHILDDHMILKLTPDKRIRIVAGRPTHCSSVITAHEEAAINQESMSATQIFLETPQSIAFSANGDLFVGESDSQMINRVRVVSNNGKMHRYAGVDLKCSCMEINCECFDSVESAALSAKLSTISSITVTPDGRLHICDQGNLRIRTVFLVNPRLNANQEFEVSDQNELFVFNRYGQHIATKSSTDGQTKFTFAYNDNTSSGKLSSVTDASGNKVFLLRDYTNQVKSIESARSGQFRLTMSRTKLLHTFAAPEADKLTFTYYGNTGLLKSRSDSAEAALIYNYDANGRLTSAVTPSGEEVKLNFTLSNNEGPCVRVIKGDSSQSGNKESVGVTPVTLPSVSRMRRVAPFGF